MRLRALWLVVFFAAGFALARYEASEKIHLLETKVHMLEDQLATRVSECPRPHYLLHVSELVAALERPSPNMERYNDG